MIMPIMQNQHLQLISSHHLLQVFKIYNPKYIKMAIKNIFSSKVAINGKINIKSCIKAMRL